MDAQILATCAQTAHVAHQSSVSGTVAPTFGTAVAWRVRCEDHREDVTAPDGTQRGTTHRLIGPPLDSTGAAFVPAMTDAVWLPGDSAADATLRRKPVRVFAVPDELGSVDHYEVML